MRIIASKRFISELEKIGEGNTKLADKVSKKLKLLSQDFRHPSLRLHKLSGSNNYSASVDMSIRIIFQIDGEMIYLSRIGKHEEVY